LLFGNVFDFVHQKNSEQVTEIMCLQCLV